MNYLNITAKRIKQELSSFKDKIKNDAEYKVEQTSQFFKNVIGLTFFASLVTLAFSTITFADHSSALAHGISACVAVISFIAFVSSAILAVSFDYIEDSKHYREKIYEKNCKEYCEKYKVDNLEDDDSLQKVLINIFGKEFLEDKSDIEFYQHLYVDEMLRPDELDKINKFLKSNKISFKDYALALDNKLLANIVGPYRDEIRREIESAVTGFFLEKDRAKQEEERAKSAERRKQDLLIRSSNTFASSMLGKNLAIWTRELDVFSL